MNLWILHFCISAGPICYLLFVLPSSWILDIKGLRWAMLLSTFLVARILCIRLQPAMLQCCNV